MPKFLEEKLKKEYGDNPHAIYGTLNKLHMMKGNKETAKGERAEEKHEKKMKGRAIGKIMEKHRKEVGKMSRGERDEDHQRYGD